MTGQFPEICTKSTGHLLNQDLLGGPSLTGLNISSAHPTILPPAVVVNTFPCISYNRSLVVTTTHALFSPPFLPEPVFELDEPFDQKPNDMPVTG